MRKIIMMLVLLAGMGTAVRAQDAGAEALFAQELKEKCAGVNSIECRFVQTRSAAALERAVEKEGRYYFLQPYRVLLAFEDGDYIKITSTMFEIRQDGRTSATRVGSNPMLKSLNKMLAACISGDASQLTSGFASEVTADERTFTLRLLPLRGRSHKGAETLLVFDRKDMSLQLLKMEEPSGDYLQYRFFDVKYNADTDPSLFDIR